MANPKTSAELEEPIDVDLMTESELGGTIDTSGLSDEAVEFLESVPEEFERQLRQH